MVKIGSRHIGYTYNVASSPYFYSIANSQCRTVFLCACLSNAFDDMIATSFYLVTEISADTESIFQVRVTLFESPSAKNLVSGKSVACYATRSLIGFFCAN